MLPIWYLILGGILSTLTVVANGAVIFLIITRQRLHTTMNWFILSLSTADFFVGAGYFIADYLCERLKYSQNICYAIASFLAAASATNLCAMTLDRYIAIVKPLNYVTCTTRRAAVLTSIPWIVSFVPHLVFLLRLVLFPTVSGDSDYRLREFILFDFVFFEIVPVAILLLATGHIFIIARRHSRQTAVLMAQLRFNQRIEDDEKIFVPPSRLISSVHVVGASVAVFVVCYVIEVCFTIRYQLPLKTNDEVFHCIMELVYIINSAVNPVVYAFFKKDIREGLKSMFRCARRTPVTFLEQNASKTIRQLAMHELKL